MKLHKNCGEERLAEYGFSKYGTRYVYKIPLYRYKKNIVIEMVVTEEIDKEESYVTYDVTTNGDMYVPYYNNEYSLRNIVLRKIKRKVNTEIKKLKESEIIESENKQKR